MLPLEAVYTFDPVPSYDMYLPGALPEWCDTPSMRAWQELNYPETAAALEGRKGSILGAQANLWTEYVATETAVEYMLLPRLCAFAETVWSPRAHRDWASFRARLSPLLALFDHLGVNYRALDPPGVVARKAGEGRGAGENEEMAEAGETESAVSSHGVRHIEMPAPIV